MKPLPLRFVAGALCFAVGLAADRMLHHPRAVTEAGSTATNEAKFPPLPETAAMEVRSVDRHRQQAPVEDLVSRLLDGDWSDATNAELVQRLADDPGLINAIWRQAPEDQRDRLLFRVLAFGCHPCPSLVYRILLRIDFDIPSPQVWKASDIFKGCIYCDPERGTAALRAAASHFQEKDLRDTLLWISNNSRAGSRGLLKAALLPGPEGFGNDAIFQGAATTLWRAGEPLPPGAENLPGVARAMESKQTETANLKAAQEWQAAGFSVEALQAAAKSGRPAEGLERLVWRDVIPPPGAFVALAANGRGHEAQNVLETLVRSQPDQAFAIIKSLPDFEQHDTFVSELVTRPGAPGFAIPELLELAGTIKDSTSRDAATSQLLERLVNVDPQKADSMLGRIADPDLRQQVAEKISEQEVEP